jgi:multiple sugar transport system substrate-binding protein
MIVGRWWPLMVLCLLAVVLSGLSACQGSPTTPLSRPEAYPTATVGPGEAALTPISTAETPLPGPSVITLTLWTKESFSPIHKEGGPLLAGRFEAFTAERPDVTIDYILKKPYGKGGILDFLRTTQAVVPNALPDLVAIDVFELGQAAQDGLVQPLDDLISPDLQNDLFPFASEAGRVENRLMGLQFEADVRHLIYDTDKVGTPPLTWSEVLTGGVSYIFPAGGDQERVNDDFLIQYFALGGRLMDENGQPAIDEELLAQALGFYKDSHEGGIIPLTVLDYKTVDDCWSAYLEEKAAMSNVNFSRYLANRAALERTSFAPIPTRDGVAATVSQGWALALVTADPDRQALAAQFIEWLLSAENNAAWNQAVGYLPTRRSALEYLDTSDEYLLFATALLEVAHPRPSVPAYDLVAKALQRAVQNVLLGEASPSEAATEMILAVEK